MQKIVFYNKNFITVGGVFYQFLDLAAYIAKHTEYEAYYVNYTHPIIEEKYAGSGIIFIDINRCDFSQFEDAIFITPINYVFYMLEDIRSLKNARICVYFYHPDVISWFEDQFYLSRRAENKLNPLYNMLIDTKGYFMMDLSNLQSAIRRTNLPWEDIYVPVSLHPEGIESHYNLPKISELSNNGTLRIGWLGRLDNEKIYTVINAAENLMKYSKADRIDFHVIGDGNARNKIELKNYTPKIRFIFTSYLYNETRDKYILDNIDIMIAQGLSAVDVAMLGVPTVIPIVSTKMFWTDIFVYVHETRDYSLGWNLEDAPYMGCKTHTISEIIDDVYSGRKLEIGAEQKQFCENYFSLKNAAELLVKNLSQCELTVSKFLQCSTVERQIKDFDLYRKIRPMRDYRVFHQFVIKVNRASELKKTKRLLAYIGIVVKRNKEHVYNAGKRRWSLSQINKTRGFLKVHFQYGRKLRRISRLAKENKKIKVAFIDVFSSVFPTRPVFEEMMHNEHFDPYIIIAPNVERTHDYLLEIYLEAVNALKQEYPGRVIEGYDIKYDQYLELKDDYSLIFFNNPYPNLVHEFHSLDYFLDKDVLTIYMNYGFAALAFWNVVLSTDFYNKVWVACLESKMNLKHLKKHEQIFGLNGLVTGYLKMDKMARIVPKERSRKRILICPHHTVWGWNKLNIGNFVTYAQFFLTLPKRYPEIDFVFRPHPLLFKNLINYNVWTQEEIDQYITEVESNNNMVYDTSAEYFDQFVNSDAMIHDCGSFIGEYLFTEKPCCYMLKTPEQAVNGLVPLGQKCMEQYYHAFSEKDIIRFIEDVVVKGIDPLKGQREKFVQKELKFNYPNSAKNLVNWLEKKIFE